MDASGVYSSIKILNAMKSKFVFATLLIVVAVFAQAQQKKKPNIIVIWGDDIGFWNISAIRFAGWMGNTVFRVVTGLASDQRLER